MAAGFGPPQQIATNVRHHYTAGVVGHLILNFVRGDRHEAHYTGVVNSCSRRDRLARWGQVATRQAGTYRCHQPWVVPGGAAVHALPLGAGLSNRLSTT